MCRVFLHCHFIKAIKSCYFVDIKLYFCFGMYFAFSCKVWLITSHTINLAFKARNLSIDNNNTRPSEWQGIKTENKNMKNKTLKAIFAGAVLAASCLTSVANAGLINVDVNNDGSNTGFSVEGSGLVWMDFGQNNTDTYDFVASNLGAGQKYDGWDLASADEVKTMWSAIFSPFAAGATYYNKDQYGTDGLRIEYRNGDVFGSVFDIIGTNAYFNIGSTYEQLQGYGLFEGTGGLSHLWFVIHKNDAGGGDVAYLQDNGTWDSHKSSTNSFMSTMLVQRTNNGNTAVPEPSTLAIFALGMMGLVARRFKKNA
jgi:hypothetical protein